MKAKAFDTRLFKRILKFTKPYQGRFNGVVIFAITLSVFAALRPYLLKQTVSFRTLYNSFKFKDPLSNLRRDS